MCLCSLSSSHISIYIHTSGHFKTSARGIWLNKPLLGDYISYVSWSGRIHSSLARSLNYTNNVIFREPSCATAAEFRLLHFDFFILFFVFFLMNSVRVLGDTSKLETELFATFARMYFGTELGAAVCAYIKPGKLWIIRGLALSRALLL